LRKKAKTVGEEMKRKHIRGGGSTTGVSVDLRTSCSENVNLLNAREAMAKSIKLLHKIWHLAIKPANYREKKKADKRPRHALQWARKCEDGGEKKNRHRKGDKALMGRGKRGEGREKP